MLSGLGLFGGFGEAIPETPVPHGHKGVTVLIDGHAVVVDVDKLADSSGLFFQLRSGDLEKEFALDGFPGGVAVFRQIAALLAADDDFWRSSLIINDDNFMSLFEAAWLLECPRIFDELMDSSFIRALSSRRKVELLEHLLPFTAASSPTEGQCQGQDAGAGGAMPGAESAEQFINIFLVETRMWQRIERAAIELAAQLDTGDFVLGPRLATGSLRVCCELLRLYIRRAEGSGFVTSAFQPFSTLWKNLVDKPLRARVSWDTHYFALMCMRKRLLTHSSSPPGPAGGGLDAPSEEGGESVPSRAGMAGELEEDEEAKADIPDTWCATVEDDALRGLMELVEYIDISRVPPNWTALLIRTLLLNGQRDEAQRAFVATFAKSACVQELAWRKPAVAPVEWLADVAEHVDASKVLLRVLGDFREMDAEAFCDLVENVLLAKFHPSEHCSRVLLSSELINEIVGACFDAARKADAPRESECMEAGAAAPTDAAAATAPRERRCPKHWAGQHLLWRLHHVGTRLFNAAFVPQCGYLPHVWPDCFAEDPTSDMLFLTDQHEAFTTILGGALSPRARPDADGSCRLEPLVVEVSGHCLWDEGLLKIPLLHPIMDFGRTSQDPTLRFGRRVIMRHLWYTYNGSYCSIPGLQALWELACWPLCRDASLIHEGLEYLKGTYREQQGRSGQWCPEHEEALFRMFAALDLSRLPGQSLVSPWVPAQVQTVRLLVQQQPAERFAAELQQEVVTATESLRMVNQLCAKLSNKLNVVEQRTVINKSQINDAVVAIEEHQKKRKPIAPPHRAITGPAD